ncbi:MAG TPA: hypothetical protein DD381_12910 [Lentisphaeria bacterium]|nr:MAG: hypothetical protein A2X47_12480 [Lentisphaerae bacterium GWF2_38_69]HBM17224.1 hypothetical protein [Lentisphaeria bacterium]
MKNHRVILISGWGAGLSAWKKTIPLLSCPHTHVPWWDCLDDKSDNNLLSKLIETSKEQIILAGWSLGGMIALWAGARFNSKISGAVLIATTARMTEDRDYDGTESRVLKAMKTRLKIDKLGLINDFVKMADSGKNGAPSIMEDYIKEAMSMDDNLLKSGLTYLMQTDYRDIVHNISFPVKIVHGTDDLIINPSNSRFLCENIKNASLTMIPEMGHLIPYIAPEIIADRIKELVNCRT